MLNDSVIEALKAVPAAPEMFTKEVVIETQVKPAKASKAKPFNPLKPKAPKAPKKPKEPRVTKQAQANEIVKNLFANNIVTKDLKKQAIGDIMVMVGMTKAGATTYFYNALKAL